MTANDLVKLKEELKAEIDKADERTLQDVKELFFTEDLLDNLNDEQEVALKEALKQANDGQSIPHAEVLEKFKQWLTR